MRTLAIANALRMFRCSFLLSFFTHAECNYARHMCLLKTCKLGTKPDKTGESKPTRDIAHAHTCSFGCFTCAS